MARKKAKYTDLTIKGLSIGGGVIAGNFVASKIPVGDTKVRAGIVAAAGVVVAATQKGMVQDLGLGMIAGGGVALAKDFGLGTPNTLLAGPPRSNENPPEVMLAGTPSDYACAY